MKSQDTEIVSEVNRLKVKTGYRQTESGTTFDSLIRKKTDSEVLLIEGDTFDVIRKRFFLGERICIRKKSQEDYEDVQSLRSDWWHVSDIDETIKKFEGDLKDLKLDVTNEFRLNEIETIKTPHNADPPDTMLLDMLENKTCCELGFRRPTVMQHFQNLGFIARGYDVVKYNVMLAKRLGFDARYYDFNDCSQDLDLDGMSLVLSYQMLEHVTDPLSAIKKIYNAMDYGAFFHVEIPIEPGFPRIDFGHFYSFEEQDLERFLIQSGFQINLITKNCWDAGLDIKRVLCRKEKGPETASTG